MPFLTEQLVLNRHTVLDLMIQAHKSVAELLAYHDQQLRAWQEAGEPVKKVGGVRKADGFFVMPPMKRSGIVDYLVEQRRRIGFLEVAEDETVSLSYTEFEELTVAPYSFRSD